MTRREALHQTREFGLRNLGRDVDLFPNIMATCYLMILPPTLVTPGTDTLTQLSYRTICGGDAALRYTETLFQILKIKCVPASLN